MAKLGFSPEALQDIKEHFQYHGDYSEKAERRFADKMDEVIGHLEQFPEFGRARPEIAPSIRGFPIKALRVAVFYTFDKEQDTVLVARVLRQERDIDAVFTDD
ncbi:MAG: type II toxin-antitoxin system RelE/ParE family toxin [Bacteroidetes bacterium]|nr:type II toxin-antitoxin system RelE/ParE family toxin [Bacteroidota bacterium]